MDYVFEDPIAKHVGVCLRGKPVALDVNPNNCAKSLTYCLLVRLLRCLAPLQVVSFPYVQKSKQLLCGVSLRQRMSLHHLSDGDLWAEAQDYI